MSTEHSGAPGPPTQYESTNERGNDPWDHDTVCWMLDRDAVGEEWNYHNLFECARKQKNRLAKDFDRVLEAASLCGSLGVEQIEVDDPRLGKTIVRLRRTDVDAPPYPSHYDRQMNTSGTRMSLCDDDRTAATRLLPLLSAYESELIASGKTRSTVHTYVDRAERFLRRVSED